MRQGTESLERRIVTTVPVIYLPRVQAGQVVPVFVAAGEVALDLEGLGRIQAT